MKRLAGVLVGAVLVTSMLAVAASTGSQIGSAATVSRRIRWLAAGDSYSAGQGIANAAGICARSDSAWPVAALRVLSQTDTVFDQQFTACTGDVIDHLSQQLEEAWVRTANPPPVVPNRCWGYLNNFSGNPHGFTWSLKRDRLLRWRRAGCSSPQQRFDLITFTLGGNDIGFPHVLEQCLGVSGWSWLDVFDTSCPSGTSLLNKIDALSTTGGGVMYDGQRMAYGEFLRRVATDDLAPGGQLIVLGYPHLFASPQGWPIPSGCAGMASWDINLLNQAASELNTVLADQARAANENDGRNRIHYIDVTTAFAGHELCGSLQTWLNGISGISILNHQHSFHTNAAGNSEEASLLVGELQNTADVPKSFLSGGSDTGPSEASFRDAIPSFGLAPSGHRIAGILGVNMSRDHLWAHAVVTFVPNDVDHLPLIARWNGKKWMLVVSGTDGLCGPPVPNDIHAQLYPGFPPCPGSTGAGDGQTRAAQLFMTLWHDGAVGYAGGPGLAAGPYGKSMGSMATGNAVLLEASDLQSAGTVTPSSLDPATVTCHPSSYLSNGYAMPPGYGLSPPGTYAGCISTTPPLRLVMTQLSDARWYVDTIEAAP